MQDTFEEIFKSKYPNSVPVKNNYLLNGKKQIETINGKKMQININTVNKSLNPGKSLIPYFVVYLKGILSSFASNKVRELRSYECYKLKYLQLDEHLHLFS